MAISIPTLTLRIIVVITFIANMLIIGLTIKIKKSTHDWKYLIGLAIADSYSILIILNIMITYSITGESPHKIPYMTPIIGFIEMAGPSLSSQLGASLALYRLTSIYQYKPKKVYTILPLISSIIVLILLTINAATNGFKTTAAGLSTQPSPYISTISAITFYYLFIHVFICDIIIIVCYILVLKFTYKVRNAFILENEEEENASTSILKMSHLKKVNIMGWLFIILSGFILIPGALFLLIGSLISNSDAIPKSIIIGVIAAEAFFFVVGGLINSLLVLFFHPGINNLLKKLIFRLNPF